MTIIPKQEIQYSNLSLVDQVGRVFCWKDQVYRAIPEKSAEHVLKLFRSGLIDKLISDKLIPNSQISDAKLEGYSLVIEHDTIPCITYPHEWSFSMYRDAGLLAIKVAEIAMEFGYRLKDSHPYNVLFWGTEPLFVDIGSLVDAQGSPTPVPDDFESVYLYPLSIWSSGDTFLAKRIINSASDIMPASSWHQYKSGGRKPTTTRLPTPFLKIRDKCRRIARDPKHLVPSVLRRAIDHDRSDISDAKQQLGRWRRKIQSLRSPDVPTMWANYHDEYFVNGDLKPTNRFSRLIEIVKEHDPKSVVELAGNQGLFSLMLLEKTDTNRVLCTDADFGAIDRLYRYCGEKNLNNTKRKIFPAVIDFMIPEMNYFTSTPSSRFQCDIVLALAVTHHLLLTHGFRLDDVIRRIAEYTTQYAIIEFMPLGLWDGNTSHPIPEWYHEQWFRNGFCEHFDLVLQEQLESNRVVFVGKKKQRENSVNPHHHEPLPTA
ncbi:hypothetical protein [Novipirellula sp.]|uniref:hypothetical protein n=1 Tax=Novipirellula sp. TaxID=2795430 RepID=UPI00356588B4